MSTEKPNQKKNEDEHRDFLKKVLGDIQPDIKEIKENAQSGRYGSPLHYLNVPLDKLPMGIFYRPGTDIRIRPATVAEVQAYSVVDDANYVDVVEKMNALLKGCVRYTHANGMAGSYKDVKDGDRIYLVFMIRELTFQKGNSLAKDFRCPHCSTDQKIQYRATTAGEYKRTFVNYAMSDKIDRYFNADSRTFDVTLEGATWRLGPPNIGIQEVFTEDIKDNVRAERTPNVPFLKIIPFTLWDRASITPEGIRAKEKEFKELSMDTWQGLNWVVDQMKFGIKELESICTSCGLEVRTDFTFPDRPSTLLLVSNPLG